MKVDGADMDSATTAVASTTGDGESTSGVVATASEVPSCWSEVQLSMKERMYTDAFEEIKRV